jgi:hypothetical protein
MRDTCVRVDERLELSGDETAGWHLHYSCRLFGNR